MLKVFVVVLLVTMVSSLKVGMRNVFQKVAICGASLAFVACEVPSSFADSRNIANIQTSGVIFKDTLKVNAFEDPKVSGVTLYLSDFDRPVTEKMSGDFFSDPASSALRSHCCWKN